MLTARSRDTSTKPSDFIEFLPLPAFPALHFDNCIACIACIACITWKYVALAQEPCRWSADQSGLWHDLFIALFRGCMWLHADIQKKYILSLKKNDACTCVWGATSALTLVPFCSLPFQSTWKLFCEPLFSSVIQPSEILTDLRSVSLGDVSNKNKSFQKSKNISNTFLPLSMCFGFPCVSFQLSTLYSP